MERPRDARGRYLKKRAALPAPEPDREEVPSAGPSDHFLAELQASWARHGAETIETVRNDRPQDYLRLMASSLAKQTDPAGEAIDRLSDDEIADELRNILAQLAAAGAGPGA